MTVKKRLMYDALIAPFSGIKGGHFLDEMRLDLMRSYGAYKHLSNRSASVPMAF